ncbi:TAXI family TRAP transporter solute-binding subunit [Bacillus sp. FJAT-45350]|uniref:TAXI family TRAP transporter solute-binding subunit n=1 Tax=Bacillus sp. FJAT-45350 TaxID=2011014 RepID=UPI000BB9AC2A|nr:TAXI family TRAP transporter solute-binding subunit [Bacillus sp. FJAT-45350]
MKRFKSLILSAIVGLVLVGCSSGDSSSEIEELRFPTAGTSGTIYPLGATMSNIWNNNIEGIRVNSQASNGGVNNLNLLNDGEGHISFATTGIMWEAYNGEDTFEGRQYEDLRIMAGLYINPNQFVVRDSADINSIADIKGKRFVPGAVGSTPEVESSIILPEYGINYPDDINETYVGFTEAIDLMRNNQVEGAIIQAGIPTAAVTEMTSTADGKLIGIEPEIRQSLMDKYPWYSEFTIPAGTYDNQDQDIDTLGIKMMLIVDASLSDDLVYELTKVFWENLDELEASHSIAGHMDINEAMTDTAGIPIHDGAKKYYEEKGISE